MDRAALEERIAHLIRTTDELSEVAATQERRLAQLEARVRVLSEREASRQEDEGAAVFGDRPPHW